MMVNQLYLFLHKLNEIMQISDRISVMRQGEYMGTVDKKDTNQSRTGKDDGG